MFTVVTGRLRLRPFSPGDATSFAAYRSDPDVARFQSWDIPYSLAAAEQLIAEMQARTYPRPGEWNQIAIELRWCENPFSHPLQRESVPAAANNRCESPLNNIPNPTLIGDCAFQLLAADERQARIGFTLARPFQGRGYATEAVRALLADLFDRFELHRITADCDVRNIRSQRVLERVGMRREPDFAQSVFFKGEWAGEYVYSLMRSK